MKPYSSLEAHKIVGIKTRQHWSYPILHVVSVFI